MQKCIREKIFLWVIILTVILVFHPILKNKFLYYWDDQWVVINHYTQGGFNFSNLWSIFTEFYHGQYAPLNELNYLIIYSIFGYDPFWFHFFSLLWHISNAVLVYYFLKSLLKLSGQTREIYLEVIPFLTALLFSIHPLTVESTAWISASKVLIYSFFYLLALMFYIQYLKNGKSRFFILTFIFFCLSFGGKEQAVTLPFCLLLIDWFSKRNLKNIDLWIEKLPFFATAILFGLITILSQEGGGNAPQYPLFQRFLLSFYTVFEYLIKCIFPFNLSYLYPFPMQVGEAIPVRFMIYPVVVAFLGYVIYVYRKNRILIFSILFFIIHLLVALHIISISRFSIVADRYAYLSLIGVMFFIVYHFVLIIQKKKRVVILILSSLFLVYMLYLGTYTHKYSKKWYDTDSLKYHLRELLKQRKDYSEDTQEYKL